MRFGLIGYGSIGKRHASNLIKLGHEDIILFREIGKGNEHNFPEYNTFSSFLKTNVEVVIISNPTSLHARYLSPLITNNIHVFVEKPIVSNEDDMIKIKKLLSNYTGLGMTALNMRFHPCIDFLKKHLERNKLGSIYSARFFVGQYLPDWHPDEDYTKSYSANMDLGGGVLFDLVHEIDLACYLIGKPFGNICSQVDKVSNLEINTEDLAEILYRTKNNRFVSIHLDYLTQGYKRYIEIIGEKGSLKADLFKNEILIMDNKGKIHKHVYPNFSKNDMYLSMLNSFIKSINGKINLPISLQDGMISNKIALGIRRAMHENF